MLPFYFADCGKAGDFRSITSHFRRRRAPEFSYQSDSAANGEALEMLENLRGQMYNRQEIDLKMHHMENRIKDMQGIVQAMDHSMKKMKRNVYNAYIYFITLIFKGNETDGNKRYGIVRNA